MRWMMLLAAVLVGAGIYFGYIRVPSLTQIKGDIAGLTGVAPRWAITGLEHEVLEPLTDKKVISTNSAQAKIEKIRDSLKSSPNTPDTVREAQALRLIEQALQERNATLAQLKKGAPENKLDDIPGRWHVIGHPETSFDITKYTTGLRTSFWAQAGLNQWNARCKYYQTAIDSLLTPPTPKPVH